MSACTSDSNESDRMFSEADRTIKLHSLSDRTFPKSESVRTVLSDKYTAKVAANLENKNIVEKLQSGSINMHFQNSLEQDPQPFVQEQDFCIGRLSRI